MHKEGNNGTLGNEAVRLTTSKVITLVISMLTSMFLSRYRSFEEYGTYSELLLVITLFSSLLMLGLPSSINYFIARAETPLEKRHFLSVFYTLSTILSFVIGILLVVSIPLIESYFKNKLIGKFFYFLALYPWASIISSSIENVLVVYHKTKKLMVYRLVHSIAMLATVLIVEILGWGFSKYMLLFVAVNCCFAVYVYFIASRLGNGIKPLLDFQLVKKVLVFSVPMGLAAIVGTINSEIDKLLIGFLMNVEQLAIYTNAAKELPLAVVSSSITAVLLPHIILLVKKNEVQRAIELWGYATEFALIILALIVAGVFTYAEDVIRILYSSKYIPGANVFRIYTLVILLRITYFGMILNAYGETKKIFYCSLLSMIINVVLNPLFYYCCGMIGPAIATFVSILIIQILQLIMSSRKSKTRFRDIFPWKRFLNVLCCNIVFSIAFWGLKKISPIRNITGTVIESLILGIVWTILYFLLYRKRLKMIWNRINSFSQD